jgi:fibronectin-binding autotransporter adhesin
LADGTSAPVDILPPQAGRFWIASGGGTWSNAANWSGGVVPGPADTVFITLGGTYTVTVDVNDTVAFLIVGGGSGIQTLNVGSRTFGIDSGATFGPTTALNLTNSTLNGASGSLANQGSFTVQSSVVNPAFVNAGSTKIRGAVNFNGEVNTTPGSTFRIEGDAFFSTATATVLNDFLNLGTIDLTAINASGTTAQLNVTNGTLLNAVGATINVLPGTGGARVMGAELDNQGALIISQPLTLSKPSAAHQNSGTIDLAGGDLSVTQSGTGPSFSTSGSINIGGGDTLTVSNGSFDFDGGTLSGTGRVVFTSTTANLTPDMSTATLAFSITNATVNGPGSFTNSAGRTTVVTGGTFNAPLINEGQVIVRSVGTINGSLTTTAGSTLRIEGDAFFSSATATLANGFTNNGTIELSAINGSGTTAQLNVTTGALVNGSGGAIHVLAGNGGARTIGAQLNNQGILTVTQPLTLSKTSAAHQNSGTIDISGGDLTISQSGVGAGFTTAGSIVIGAGRTLAVTSGLFDYAGGTLGGTGTVQWNGGTLNLGASLSNATLSVTLTNQTVNGPGSLTNAAGRTLILTGGIVNAPLANQGLLTLRGVPTLNGALTTTAGSTLRVEGDAFFSSATTTVLNGFVNNGTIELNAINGSGTTAQLNVTTGTLVNAAGATINSLTGNGGGRTIGAQLDNQGIIVVSQPLTISKTSAAHQSSGTIDVVGADLTLTQSGGGASFTISAGAINVTATRTFSVLNGTFNYAGGTVGGAGSVVWNNATVNLTPDFDNAITGLTLTNAVVNGPGRLTNTAGRTLILTGGQISAPVANDGQLIVRGSASMTGPLTTSAGSTLRVEGDAFFSSALLTVQNGFTNLGTIELDAVNGSGTTAQLTVTTGTLVNAVGAVITALPGAGSTRHLSAQLDNQGSIVVNQPLTINKASAAHLNSGTIDVVGANLTLPLAGVGASFSTSGTVTVDTGRTLDVSGGGAFSFTGGSLSGSGSITWNGGTVNLSQSLGNSSLNLTLSNTTVNGPGTFTNAPGRTLVMTSGVMNAPLDNQGVLTIRGGPAINGSVTTGTASLLRVEGDAFFSSAQATFLNGFTNTGTIELTSINGAGAPSQISVTNGTLVNAPGATIDVQAGSGSTRNLNASLDNQGTVNVGQSLTFGRSSSVISNSGTINLTTGDLLISQSGTSPSVTNTGTVTVGAGRTWTVTGGAWTHDGGTLGGNALVLTSVNPAVFNKAHGFAAITLNGTTASFSTPQATDATQFTLTNSTVNGTITFTNAVGKSLVMTGGTLNVAFANNGLLKLRGTSAVKGVLTTFPGSTLQVEGDAFFSSAFATIDQGFVNNGTIELTAVNGGGAPAQLSVTNGTLANAAGATIAIEPGSGGSRALNAMLDNQGLVKVNQPVTISRFNALHVNSGTIDVTGGDLTITQSGGNPGFINSAPGTVGIAAGRTLKITAGNVTNEVGAQIVGSGTFDVSAPVTFSSPGELAPGTSAGILTVLGNAQLTAASTLTIELGGPTEGTEYDQLRISGDVLLAGVLNVTTINGFNPAGLTFIILRSGSNGGGTRFGVANLPPGCSQPAYTPTQVQFTCS